MLILHHANVITLDPASPRAGLVAVQGGRIAAVGGNDLLATLQGPGTKLLDCEGKTVVPGFDDAHCHVLAFARSLLSVDCSPESVGSIEEMKAKLRQRAAVTPTGAWITGTGYNEFYLAEKRHPNRHDLDQAVPIHPVKLGHRSGHCCVLNSLALRVMGIGISTPEPPGAVIDREPGTAEPSGLLYEMNHLVDRAIPPLSPQELERGVKLADQHFLSLGITSLQDATADNDLARWHTLQSFKGRGILSSRLTLMVGGNYLEELAAEGMLSAPRNEDLRIGPVKLMVTQSTGSLFPAQEELGRQVRRAHELGASVAIHAVEESSIEAAVIALEHALHGHPPGKFRDRIEHCSECTPSLLRRLKALRAVIVTQPPFLYYSGERYLSQVPLSQQPWLYRIGSFWRSGLTTAASSDSPVIPCNPMVGIYAAVTRKAQNGQVLLPHEGISPLQALAMYTINAAYASFQEEIKGSITPGKLADLVVLSADPTAVPPEEIMNIKVELTVLDGRITWGSGAL